MTVYLVIHEDRHTDVSVEVFTSQADAVENAEAIASDYDNAVVEPVEGWIYNARLSDEGDYVSVREVEVNE